MKKIKYLIKMFLAGIVALAILCLISVVYCLSPIRVENTKENTDYVWQYDKMWIKMTEGISYGRVDNNGFNNKDVIDNPDIIFLGSSHIEGMNVNQNDHVCALLNEKFEGSHCVYNMGISGHTFFKVVQYLEESISLYDSVEYVFIESSTTNLTAIDVNKALNNQVEITKVNNKGLVAKLQRLPFLREVYQQYNNGMKDMLLDLQTKKGSTGSSVNTQQKTDLEIDVKPYDAMFAYLSGLEDKYGVQIVIVYHPFEVLQKDGTITFNDMEYTNIFAQRSAENNIDFVDMTSDFERIYYEEHHVAHGFSTGELAKGHINKYGHEAIAERLYEFIYESEEGK